MNLAYKSTFMIGIRIGVIILSILFLIIPNEDIIFTYLQYVMIAYGIYNLIKLVVLIIQPKVLITQDEYNIVIWGINKSTKINMNDIDRIEAKQSSTRGVSHKFGNIIIKLHDNRVIKVNNVDDVLETKANIEQLIKSS